MRSIMLNILGEADGEEGIQRAHEVMARAYQVPLLFRMLSYPACPFQQISGLVFLVCPEGCHPAHNYLKEPD